MTFLRSMLFNACFYLLTAVIGFCGLPLMLAPRRYAIGVVRLWGRCVILLLRGICGVRIEMRGMENIPAGGVVLASKHQSAFDTIVWLSLLPDPAYVLKKELLSIPLYGWFCRKAGMIPVDRAGGGAALRTMLRAAQVALGQGRQIVIFPEGTRSAPGDRLPYLPGVVAIAGVGAPVVPVATDSGRVWGRNAFLKHPGTIRVSVLPPLPPGLPRAKLLATLEEVIEGESTALLAEQG